MVTQLRHATPWASAAGAPELQNHRLSNEQSEAGIDIESDVDDGEGGFYAARTSETLYFRADQATTENLLINSFQHIKNCRVHTSYNSRFASFVLS